jgi:hypothetical protein
MAVKKRGGQPKNSNARKTFYNPSLPRAPQFAEAASIEGLDSEITLLRMNLRCVVVDSPERVDLITQLTDSLVKAIKCRHQIASGQKSILKDAITKVLEDIAKPVGVKKIL